MKRVVITGTAGLLGPSVAQHFVESGYDVLSVDVKRPAVQVADHRIVDLTNLGECYGILAGADALVHLAAIPNALTTTNEVTFRNNVMSTYNLLEAADALGIKKAVTASSESAYGLVFSKKRLVPQYVPVDENHPCVPADAYALGKLVEEETARAINRRNGMQIVALRIGNVITKEIYEEKFAGWCNDPNQRTVIMWSYIDARDVATACRLAIEKDGLGVQVLNVAADDNCTTLTSAELMKHGFPEVTDIRGPIDGYQTLLSNEKIKKVLGWKPAHFWRDNVPGFGGAK
jgi:nucleoside-diphosphate-sugar epimerase